MMNRIMCLFRIQQSVHFVHFVLLLLPLVLLLLVPISLLCSVCNRFSIEMKFEFIRTHFLIRIICSSSEKR